MRLNYLNRQELFYIDSVSSLISCTVHKLDNHTVFFLCRDFPVGACGSYQSLRPLLIFCESRRPLILDFLKVKSIEEEQDLFGVSLFNVGAAHGVFAEARMLSPGCRICNWVCTRVHWSYALYRCRA